MDNFLHQQSVWNLVKENVPCSELPEIRAVLGDALIDTYTELYSEVQMWEKIWQELHFLEQGSRPEAPVFPLADPPALKELLKAEIQLLLLTLREKAARQGRDEEEVIAQYSPNVVSYALGSTNRQRGPGTRCERKSPSRPPSSLSETGSRSVSSLSSHSSCEEEIKALRHKLNIIHIDEVVAHLRSVLTEESEALRKDVQALQESLEAERASTQTEPVCPEPTLAELKEERRLIQRDLNVQGSMSCSYKTNNLSTRNPQNHTRGALDLALSTDNSETTKPSNSAASRLKPCPPRDTNHTRSNRALTISSGGDSTVSVLEHEDNMNKHRRHSLRASAFRLIPAASVKHFLRQMEETGNGDPEHLNPTPPVVQITADRGRKVSRQIGFSQPDGLLTSH
ncbi:coiled-coil domain-containing protein 24 [Danio aesculapii]|uniref:coiled-coil domain-containing protein 24 n=1 Tax=Danio aesculapii TaxID=1142201 RepID=UPI0024BF2C34|nr:coiled-coil domain-containing protein 24 [Danio aesculapii]